MKTNVVMHLTALSGVNGNNSLREGGSVYVRIIKSAGNNSYIASFSGGRFLLKSEIPLSEGAGFPAKIKIENGKILLQKIHSDSHKDSVQKITAENKNPFLEKLGLPPDSLSYSMLQQMKMLGSRFSLESFQKFRKIAEKIKNKEKSAGDAAFILEEKGIPADEKKVLSVLGGSEKERDSAEEIFQDKNNFSRPAENSFSEFFSAIFNSSANLKNQPGILTLFNHLGFSFASDSGGGYISKCKTAGLPDSSLADSESGFGSWIKIPFEFSAEEKAGKGSFCGFLRNRSKKLEKAVISFCLEEKDYVFEVGIREGDISYLNAGCSDSLRNKMLNEILKSFFGKIKIGTIKPLEDFSEFSADEIEFSTVSLNV